MRQRQTTARTARRPRPHRRAFSLVELVITLVLIGTLAALAVPRFANASANRRLESAAHRVIADGRYAQARARATSDDYTVDFVSNSSYLLYGDSKREARTTDLSAEPYGVACSVKLLDGETSITFNGFGVPSTSGLIELTRRGQTVTLTIDAVTGEVIRP
jgi:prepilin-type N-terminal cleavage/methylation domain-containing protein